MCGLLRGGARNVAWNAVCPGDGHKDCKNCFRLKGMLIVPEMVPTVVVVSLGLLLPKDQALLMRVMLNVSGLFQILGYRNNEYS